MPAPPRHSNAMMPAINATHSRARLRRGARPAGGTATPTPAPGGGIGPVGGSCGCTHTTVVPRRERTYGPVARCRARSGIGFIRTQEVRAVADSALRVQQAAALHRQATAVMEAASLTLDSDSPTAAADPLEQHRLAEELRSAAAA